MAPLLSTRGLQFETRDKGGASKPRHAKVGNVCSVSTHVSIVDRLGCPCEKNSP